jgi:hypothetical protein
MPTELPTIWLIVGPPTDSPDDYGNGRRIYAVHYSASGLTCTLRQHYSGRIVARAGGGGYDRAGVCLADALHKDYGVPAFDGARGVDAVRQHAERHGVGVYRLADALYALPVPAVAELDGEAVAR